jgi:sarcosine oxidase subunit gamma
MAETLRRRSPLASRPGAFESVNPAVRIVEVPWCSQVNLRLRGVRADPEPGAPADAVAAVLGCRIPVEPCTSRTAGLLRVLWLGPDEWLVLGPDRAAPALVDDLKAALGGGRGAVTDVSAERSLLRVSGGGAQELLAKGCSIDLHPAVRPNGACVQTLLAQAGVILVVCDDTATDFLLLVRASFTSYMADWLIDAAGELDG